MNAKSKFGISCLLALLAAACGDSNDTPSRADAGPPNGDGAAPAPTWTATVLTSFDPAAGQLPEGVTVKDGAAYAGFAPLGQIAKVDLASGTSAPFGSIPKPVPGKGFMTGLSFGPDGMLYAALVSFDPTVQPGIYRIPAAGGDGSLFAKDSEMVFPNGLVFDPSGALFVTDSAAGAIYEIDPSGAVSAWAKSPLLAGDQNACGGSGNGFDIGANGLMARGGAFYVTNTDQGSVVRFAVGADGKAGPAEPVAGPDCAALSGADGIIAEPSGDSIIAVNRQNKIVRLTSGGAIEVMASGGPIDFPASLAWNGSTLVASSFAFANASAGKTARPGLVGLRTSQ